MLNRIHLIVALALTCMWTGGSASAQQKLLLTTMSPAGTPNDVGLFKPWADRVNAASNGTVSVQLSHSTTLANYGNVYDRVQDDVVQIGWLLHGIAAGQFPRSEVGNMPFVASNSEEASVAAWRLYKSGALSAEYKDVIPLMFQIFPQYSVHLRQAPRSPDNIEGLKIGVASKLQAETMRRLGATPISMQTTEIYESMQRGTVDGMLIGWGAFAVFKFQEVSTYHIDVPLGSSSASMLFMTKKKYDSLPPEARKAIDENSGESGSRSWGKFTDAAGDFRGGVKNGVNGQTIVELNPEQRAKWQDKVQPIVAEWVNATPDGAKVLDAYRGIVAQVRAEKK